MSGALIQLVSYGGQDTYLTGEPQTTFFKSVFRRHTNFAKELIELTKIKGLSNTLKDYYNTNNSSSTNKIVVTIPHNGDLLSGLTIQYNPSKLIPPSTNIECIASDLSHALIDQVEIEIGGTIIDRHYGKWLTIWRDLTQVNPYATQECISSTGEEPQSFYKRYNYTTNIRAAAIYYLLNTRTEQRYVTNYQSMSYTHKGILFEEPVTITGIYEIFTSYHPLSIYDTYPLTPDAKIIHTNVNVSDLSQFNSLGGTFYVNINGFTSYKVSYTGLSDTSGAGVLYNCKISNVGNNDDHCILFVNVGDILIEPVTNIDNSVLGYTIQSTVTLNGTTTNSLVVSSITNFVNGNGIFVFTQSGIEYTVIYNGISGNTLLNCKLVKCSDYSVSQVTTVIGSIVNYRYDYVTLVKNYNYDGNEFYYYYYSSYYQAGVGGMKLTSTSGFGTTYTGVFSMFTNGRLFKFNYLNLANNFNDNTLKLVTVSSIFTKSGDIIDSTGTGTLSTIGGPSECYVPMQFWFCRNPGLALPLIALQYHEVNFNIYFNKKESFITLFDSSIPTTVDFSSIRVFGEYFYLDSAERRQFAQNSHEYLIEQLQLNEFNNGSNLRLTFNHPVKELVISGKPVNPCEGDISNTCVWGQATPYPIITKNVSGYISNSISETATKMVLSFNGTERFSPRNLKYFTRNQINEYHAGSGSLVESDCIGVYSFSIDPEEHQPSGSCNFSRIDTVFLKFTELASNEQISPLDVYAVNYNILRIMSGMGGLAYSN